MHIVTDMCIGHMTGVQTCSLPISTLLPEISLTVEDGVVRRGDLPGVPTLAGTAPPPPPRIVLLRPPRRPPLPQPAGGLGPARRSLRAGSAPGPAPHPARPGGLARPGADLRSSGRAGGGDRQRAGGEHRRGGRS